MEWWGNSLLLAPTYDPDAQAYITAVEAADGQALESGVRDAVNTLVLALKTNSLWTPALQLLLPSGARTLTGALVPLKGAAPTNNGFVSGDYSRKLGLGQTNNTTKWLNSNVLQNSLPTNTHAIGAYGSFTKASGDSSVCGYYNSASGQQSTLLALDEWAGYVSGRAFRSGSFTTSGFPVITSTAAASFMMGSRASTTSATLYVDAASVTNSGTVTPSFSANALAWFALRQSTGVTVSTSMRIQFSGIWNANVTASQAAALRSACAAYVSALAAAIP